MNEYAIMAAIRACGERILSLESCADYNEKEKEKLREENRTLKAENEALREKLGEIERFLERNGVKVKEADDTKCPQS